MRYGLFLLLLLYGLAALAADPPKPIVASPTDSEWQAKNNFAKPGGIDRAPSEVLRVFAAESVNVPYYRLSDALERRFKGQYRYQWSYEVRPSYGQVRNQIRQFPNDWSTLYDQDIYVVLGSAVGQGLSVQQRLMLEQFVKDGGSLLLCGGYWTFGSGGGWAGTAFDDLSPVVAPPTGSQWEFNSSFFPLAGPQFGAAQAKYDRQPTPVPPGSPAGSPLVPAGKNPLTDGLNWNARPLVMVANTVQKVKDGATVLVTADKAPIVVVQRYGKGKVAAILAQPLGEPPAGQTAYWDWPDWQIFLGRVIDWLKPAQQ